LDLALQNCQSQGWGNLQGGREGKNLLAKKKKFRRGGQQEGAASAGKLKVSRAKTSSMLKGRRRRGGGNFPRKDRGREEGGLDGKIAAKGAWNAARESADPGLGDQHETRMRKGGEARRERSWGGARRVWSFPSYSGFARVGDGKRGKKDISQRKRKRRGRERGSQQKGESERRG